jgi:hypothetical protein
MFSKQGHITLLLPLELHYSKGDLIADRRGMRRAKGGRERNPAPFAERAV